MKHKQIENQMISEFRKKFRLEIYLKENPTFRTELWFNLGFKLRIKTWQLCGKKLQRKLDDET